jgi:hypothetical protein
MLQSTASAMFNQTPTNVLSKASTSLIFLKLFILALNLVPFPPPFPSSREHSLFAEILHFLKERFTKIKGLL